jgi:hypothetical protein
MTAAKKPNPFEEEVPKTKTDNDVVETPEDKAGTAKDKPADAPKDIQNADGSKSEPEPEKKPTEQKAARKRRTKAEIEAAKAAEAGAEAETKQVEVETNTFDQLDFEKLPLSAVSGQIVGSVSLNSASVPTLSVALQNWIGEPPVSIAASQIGDVEKVLAELKKQAKSAKI